MTAGPEIARVVVTGASGNLGAALLAEMARQRPQWAVTGVSRRRPEPEQPFAGVDWVQLDVGHPDSTARLADAFAEADAVVHLAWALQSAHDLPRMEATNVGGIRHVIDAVRAARVPHLVQASSLGAYSPATGAPAKPRVREDWPTGGLASSPYSRQKVRVERLVDELERAGDVDTVTRIRPGLVLQGQAGSALGRYFLGALAPLTGLARRLPVLPVPGRLLGSAVHADDVADAIIRIVDQRAAGAFNLAAEPPIDSDSVAAAFGARRLPVPFTLARAAAAASWRLRIQPTDAGWLDIARYCPLLDTTRARTVLGWAPTRSPLESLAEVVAGVADGAGAAGPVLAARR